jgi:hypothetical protein
MRPSVLATVFAFAGLLGVASPALGQSEAWRIHGQSSIPAVGRSIAWLPDVDSDGVADYVAGGPAYEWFPPGNGHVLICSGATGAIRFDLAGAVGAEFGAAVARAGDVDGDGVEDVAVGAPTDGNGVVYVYSGASATLLRTLSGSAAGSRFGTSLAYLGDVDGDGVGDLAVGAPADASGGTQLGLAVIYSGATGAVLAQFQGASVDGLFGSVVADGGDLDGDGIHDLLVIEQADGGHGTLRIYSGATFQVIRQKNLGAATIGWTARGSGDVNGDGTVDIIVGNYEWPVNGTDYGGVWVDDGATGSNIYSFNTFDHVGWSVAGAGDVNGDGFADFAFAVYDNTEQLRILSGKDGSVLATASGYVGALDGGVDASGDGVPDLLVGMPLDATNGYDAGAAGVFDTVTQTMLSESFGTTREDFLGRASALLDDVDGDGTRDLLVGVGAINSLGSAKVLSGRDGSELRVHSGAAIADSYAERVAALPDLDGDGVGEYAIVVPGPPHANSGSIEIRSGATGSILKTLAPFDDGSEIFGTSCAVALQPSGALQIAIGAPDQGSTGAAYVFDVATGNVVVSAFGASANESFGASIAFVGDFDGDGVGDWAAGAPGYNAENGEVVVFSGQTGNALKRLSSATRVRFGTATCGPGDLDGDGTPDLIVGAPFFGALSGAVYAYSGATWSLLGSCTGVGTTEFGASLTDVGDVNRDGRADILVGANGSAFLYSGGSGALLHRFDGTMNGDSFGSWGAGVAAPGSGGSMNGDAIPDVAIGGAGDSERGFCAGRLSLYFLDDLYLQILPPSAAAGQTVSLTTSGGPSGSVAALFVTAFDATPMFVLTAIGTLDAHGVWTVSGSVPAGLAGHAAAFTSFTVGFNGKVAHTQPMTLTLQ